MSAFYNYLRIYLIDESIEGISSPEIKVAAMQKHRFVTNNTHSHRVKNKSLSAREMDILYWLNLGKSTQMVADILEIKLRTVKAHIANIKLKTNCHTLFQLGFLYSKIGAS